MASRTRAPARQRRVPQQGRPCRATQNAPARKRAGTRACKPPAPRRYNATPELMARVRDRFENSDDTVAAIAADLGCVTQTVYKIAQRENWVRYVPLPRDLPRASRLLAKAEALEKALEAGTLPANSEATPTPNPPSLRFGGRVSKPAIASAAAGNPSPQEPAPGRAQARPGWGGETVAARGGEVAAAARAEDEEAARAARMIDDLEREVAAELAAARTLREQLMGMPRRVRDGESTARTLAGLSQTWQTLQRIRCTLPQSRPSDDDDIPKDIDAFREALARKIEAFMESRPDEDFAEDVDAPRNRDV